MLDSLTLLPWYIPRFWKSLVRHVFPTTKLITEAYPKLLSKIPEILHYIYNSNWFPQNNVNVTEVPSEIIQKLSIIHNNIEIKNYNAKNQPFTCTNLPKNTNTSLEASPIENMDTIIRSQPTDTCINEAAEADFNSPLLDDGTLFSSDTGNTLIGLADNGQMNNHNKNNNNVANGTSNNTNIYQNSQQRQPVNSIKLTQIQIH